MAKIKSGGVDVINPISHLDGLVERYNTLDRCREDIYNAYKLLTSCYEQGGKVLIAGNGGSGADAGHIVGELMKGFLNRRRLPSDLRKRLIESNHDMGKVMAESLQGGLPAIDLSVHNALITAISNDLNGDLIYAQQIIGYGKQEDVFWGISTSGNSTNIIYAIYVAKTLGLKTIGLTGRDGGNMNDIADIGIRVPADTTPLIQELHLPIYHTLCAMIESYFFNGEVV